MGFEEDDALRWVLPSAAKSESVRGDGTSVLTDEECGEVEPDVLLPPDKRAHWRVVFEPISREERADETLEFAGEEWKLEPREGVREADDEVNAPPVASPSSAALSMMNCSKKD